MVSAGEHKAVTARIVSEATVELVLQSKTPYSSERLTKGVPNNELCRARNGAREQVLHEGMLASAPAMHARSSQPEGGRYPPRPRTEGSLPRLPWRRGCAGANAAPGRSQARPDRPAPARAAGAGAVWPAAARPPSVALSNAPPIRSPVPLPRARRG